MAFEGPNSRARQAELGDTSQASTGEAPVVQGDGSYAFEDIGTEAELTTHAALEGTSAHGATTTNTAGKLVARDGSGNFSAGAITAALTGTASGNLTSFQGRSTQAATLSKADVTGTGLVASDVGADPAGSAAAAQAAAIAASAPAAQGVTNGDLHDHSGGDGAQIDHAGLANIGSNTHAQIDTAVTNSTNHIAAVAPHSGHLDASDFTTANSALVGTGAGSYAEKAGTVTLAHDASIEGFISVVNRAVPGNFGGSLQLLSTGVALSNVAPINVTTGAARLVVVFNAGADFTGSFTITGSTKNRNTGVITPGDTEVIATDSLTTDSTAVDANGFTEYDIVNAYMTEKWFVGPVSITTADLTLTDVDVYQISYYQFKDNAGITVQGYDLMGTSKNDLAYGSVYLYHVDYTDAPKLTLQSVASEVLQTAAVTANRLYRSRVDNISVAIDGSAGSGAWLEIGFGRVNQPDWEQVTMKILATRSQTVSITWT